MRELENFSAMAQSPDQLLPYVEAVSGMTSSLCGDCILYRYENSGVLITYSATDPLNRDAMNEAVAKALQLADLEQLTVIGPEVPKLAPKDCTKTEDMYWGLKLEKIEKGPKLRNMLKRAKRELRVEKSTGSEAWTEAHEKMVERFCKHKTGSLSDESIFLFGKMAKYLGNAPEACLFSALNEQGDLKACAIGDFSAFSLAFYMFAFREQDAPPGSADLLLDEIIAEAAQRGYEYINLGLGVNSGIEFFKKKWGAFPLFPYVESSWKIKRKSWLARLLGRK